MISRRNYPAAYMAGLVFASASLPFSGTGLLIPGKLIVCGCMLVGLLKTMDIIVSKPHLFIVNILLTTGCAFVFSSVFVFFDIRHEHPVLRDHVYCLPFLIAMVLGGYIASRRTLFGRENVVHGMLMVACGALAVLSTGYAILFRHCHFGDSAIQRICLSIVVIPFALLVGLTLVLGWGLWQRNLSAKDALPISVGIVSYLLVLPLGEFFSQRIAMSSVFFASQIIFLIAFWLVVKMPKKAPT